MDHFQGRVADLLVFHALLAKAYDEKRLQKDRQDPSQLVKFQNAHDVIRRFQLVIQRFSPYNRPDERRAARFTRYDLQVCNEFWIHFGAQYCHQQPHRGRGRQSPTQSWSDKLSRYCTDHQVGDAVKDVLQMAEDGLNTTGRTHLTPSSARETSSHAPQPSRVDNNNKGKRDTQKKTEIVKDAAVSSLSRPAKPTVTDRDTLSLERCLDRLLEIDNRPDRDDARVRKEKEDLLNRVAQEMEARIGENEQDLEDITRSNRPMKIMEEFQALSSEEWLNAKMQLDKISTADHNELLKLTFLQSVFVITYKESEATLTRLLINILGPQTQSAQSSKPTGATVPAVMPGGKERSVEPSPEEKKEIVKLRDNWEETAKLHPSMTSQDFLRHLKDWLFTTNDLPNNSKDQLEQFANRALKDQRATAVMAFINSCLILSWKMVLQLPRMSIDISSGIGEKWKGEKEQEVFWGSGDPNNARNVVILYVIPSLYHGDQMMLRGKVLCGQKKSSS